MKLETLEDLLVEQLQDLYDAEHRDLELLPELTEAADDPSLVQVLQEHHEETSEQRRRLEDCFRRLGHTPVREECTAMAGLAAEAERLLEAEGDPAVLDAAVIAAKRRVAHYEIAGYGVARDLARELGEHDVADLLQQTLDEETASDAELRQVARSVVNADAAAEPA